MSEDQSEYSMPAWFDDDTQEDLRRSQGPFHVSK